MKVINHIRIKKETIGEIRKLGAVEKIERTDDGNIIVLLRDECTDGKREAVKGEYLVQFANGKWQRFGDDAFQRLCHNPSCAGKQWSDE